ncbi:hypothetical protein HDU98_003963, partial [Podochytrium sp. JEL0797]
MDPNQKLAVYSPAQARPQHLAPASVVGVSLFALAKEGTKQIPAPQQFAFHHHVNQQLFHQQQQQQQLSLAPPVRIITSQVPPPHHQYAYHHAIQHRVQPYPVFHHQQQLHYHQQQQQHQQNQVASANSRVPVSGGPAAASGPVMGGMGGNQFLALEEAFKKSSKPTRSEKKALSERLGIPYKNIQL